MFQLANQLVVLRLVDDVHDLSNTFLLELEGRECLFFLLLHGAHGLVAFSASMFEGLLNDPILSFELHVLMPE